MIPTKLSMKWTLNTLVFLLCIVAVRSHSKPVECPNCELCPIDDQGCCFTVNKTIIANGDSFNPTATNTSNDYTNCANFTCVDGYFKKEYYCPLASKPLGTGCYHIGPHKMNFHDAKHYCEKYDSHLAVLDTSEKGVRFEEDIKPVIGELVHNDMEGIFWLGASEYNQGGQHWFNGRPVKDGYGYFIGSGVDGYFISAYSKQGYKIDLHWRYKDGYTYAYPLCQIRYCERPYTCYYEGQNYNVGEIIMKDPKCECSWIECGEYGQIKAISKKKPCCVYNGEVFGDGDNVYIDKCSKLVCKKGKLVSYPYCSSGAYPDLFVPITYNGTSSCYAYVREYKTYEEAVRYCASHDSKLAEITSKGENEAVEKFLINNYYAHQQNGNNEILELWLGGRAEVCDNGKLGHFHWTSAESRRLPVEAVYEDFCDNQPSKDTGAHCLYTIFTREMNENYFCWANSACHKRKFFLCEKCASCEQIYKNVCYRKQAAGDEFYCDGDLVSSGYNQPYDSSYGRQIQTCYEEHCENGKIMQRTFVCGDEKQSDPAAGN